MIGKRQIARRRPRTRPRSARPAHESTIQPQVGAVLKWQRLVGNQTLQRHLNALLEAQPMRGSDLPPVRGIPQRQPDAAHSISRTGQKLHIQRAGENEVLDSRVVPQEVDTTEGGCGIHPRKMTYKTQTKGPSDPFGTTASKLIIEYSVDETGQVTLGCLKPEFTITIYTPVITSDEFIEKFTPLMQLLWDKYDGDIQAFSEDTQVRNFNYLDQTLRHEQMHVSSRYLAIVDLLPGYREFLKNTDGLKKGAAHFTDMTDRYWASAWDEQTEANITHERIHYLDALQMVREYQQRA